MNKPSLTQQQTLSCAVHESIKNNIQSSIFLFLQHCSTFPNDISWYLLQSKRTSRGKLEVDFLENSTLLHSPKSDQSFGQLFTSHHIIFFLFFSLQYCYSWLHHFRTNSKARNKYALFISFFLTKFVYHFSLY